MRKASSIALQAKTTTPSIQVCQNSKPHTPTAPPTADAAYALHLSRDGRAPIAQSAARPTPRRSRADRAKIEPGLQIDVVRMARIAVFKASTLVTLFVYEKSRKLPAYFIESARSSTDRAPDFESGGCRFEPCRAHHKINNLGDFFPSHRFRVRVVSVRSRGKHGQHYLLPRLPVV